MYSKCNVHLCASHFQTYHDREDYNISHSSTIDDEIGETDQVFFKANFLFTTRVYRKPTSELMKP